MEVEIKGQCYRIRSNWYLAANAPNAGPGKSNFHADKNKRGCEKLQAIREPSDGIRVLRGATGVEPV